MRRGSVSLVVMMVLYLLMAVAGVLLVRQSAAAEATYDTQRVTVVSPGTPEEIDRLLRGADGAEEERTEPSGPLTEEMVEELLQQQQQAKERKAASHTGNTQPEAPEKETETMRYYRFQTINSLGQLNVRLAPQLDAEVTATLSMGITGYVLQRGEEWSEIVTDDTLVNGYCYNEYLSFTEVPEAEFPEHIRREVRPSAALPEETEDAPQQTGQEEAVPGMPGQEEAVTGATEEEGNADEN